MRDLGAVVDMDGDPRRTDLKIGVDPLGGASVAFWGPIAERYGIDVTVVNRNDGCSVRLYVARLGRQDPHGLLVAVRHGAADRLSRTGSTSPLVTTPMPIATASLREAAV